MGYYLFDNPKLGIILAIVVEFFMVVCWLFAREKVKFYNLLAGPVLAGVFLLLDRVVETNREQLERATRQVVQAAAQEDESFIIDQLSETFFNDHGLDKSRISSWLEQVLSHELITSNKINELMVLQAEDDRGQVEFTATTVLDGRNPYVTGIPLVRSSWRFDYVRENDQYRIKKFENTDLNNQGPYNIFQHR